MPIREAFREWFRAHIRYRRRPMAEVDLTPLFEQLESGDRASVEIVIPLTEEGRRKIAKVVREDTRRKARAD